MQSRRIGSSEVASLIRREILQGQLRAGDRLPSERHLAEEHGVARGTIREALSQLEAAQLLEIKRGSGAYVTFQIDDQVSNAVRLARPLELIDSRFALEPHICRLAVLHARPEDLDRAEALLDQMETSVTDAAQFAECDKRFHTLLAEITGNSLLIWLMGQINSVRGEEQWERMTNVTLNTATIRAYNAQHRQILNAIKTREAERAAKLMKDHLETARLSLTRALET